MSSVAHRVGLGRPRARPRSTRRPVVFGGGVLWIVFFAVLLAGVVAINVAVLRLNLQLDQASSERTELRADISGLRSELSSAAATSRIARLAQGEMGLVSADPDTTTYLQLDR